MMIDSLEAGCEETTYENVSLHSIAISLKRIADMMEGKIKPVLMTAEEFEYMKAKEADHEKL